MVKTAPWFHIPVWKLVLVPWFFHVKCFVEKVTQTGFIVRLEECQPSRSLFLLVLRIELKTTKGPLIQTYSTI